MTLTEFLHNQITLCLWQFSVKGVCVIAVLYQLICYFLCFFTGTAKYDTIYLRIIVGDAFKSEIFIFCVNHIVDMFHVLCSFIFCPDYDLLRILQIFFGYAGDFGWHSCGEHQCISVLRHFSKNGVYAVCKAHIEHFISLIHDYIADCCQFYGLALHQIQQASRCSDNNMYTVFEASYLAFDGRTSVNRENFQSVYVFGIIVKVTCYLQTKFAGRTEDKCLWHAFFYINSLYNW